MSSEPNKRARCRLTLTIDGIHFSVRPISSEDDQIRRALLFIWPLSTVGALCAPHHGGKTANTAMLYAWARPRTVMVSQRMPAPGTADTLTPLERSGIPLLRTWQRRAVHFQWRSDRMITVGFLDQHDQPRSRPLSMGKMN